MKRALLLDAAAVAVLGALGWAQCCPQPAPPQPDCYTAFWLGEPVQIEIKQSWSLFCCCCCCDELQVLGWRIEAWPAGTVVYSVSLPAPVAAASFLATWDQLDQLGNQVAAGFYKVVVVTDQGEYFTYLKLVERPGCCFWPCLSSLPCGWKWCEPRVVLSRACVSPCWSPCGFRIVLPCCP
jgi:hypothetical protein